MVSRYLQKTISKKVKTQNKHRTMAKNAEKTYDVEDNLVKIKNSN